MASLFLRRAAGRAACLRSFPTAGPRAATTALPRSAPRSWARVSRGGFSTGAVRRSGGPHEEETFDEFTKRFEHEFEMVNDVFELQRNLNNAFAYDLVPSKEVIEAALRAARRVNDFPTAVRIFEAIKAKVENNQQYNEYLTETKPLRDELGVVLAEDMYPDYVPRGR